MSPSLTMYMPLRTLRTVSYAPDVRYCRYHLCETKNNRFPPFLWARYFPLNAYYWLTQKQILACFIMAKLLVSQYNIYISNIHTSRENKYCFKYFNNKSCSQFLSVI